MELIIKLFKMKKILLSLSLISTFTFAQTRYWTSYNVTIEAEMLKQFTRSLMIISNQIPHQRILILTYMKIISKIVAIIILTLLSGQVLLMEWEHNTHQKMIKIGN